MLRFDFAKRGRRLMAAALGVALAFALAPSAVEADILACKRSDGTVHYTNQGSGRGRCRVVVRAPKRKPFRAKRRAARRKIQQGKLERLISEAAARYTLPESLLRAVVQVESAGYVDAVSPKGAQGLMQLMPRTAESMGVSNAFDAAENVMGGARYLRFLLNRFDGDVILAVAAYNAGESAVDKYGGIPPYKETQRYVRRVLDRYSIFAGAEPKADPSL